MEITGKAVFEIYILISLLLYKHLTISICVL